MNAKPEERLTDRPRVRTALRWLAGATIAVIYLAIFVRMPLGVFYSPDSGGKYLQLIGYRWDGGLKYTVTYPGAVCDPQGLFQGHNAESELTTIYPYLNQQGKLQTGWPALFPLMTRPLYLTFGMIGLYILPLLAGLLVIALAGLLAERLRPGTGPAAAGGVGLASPLLFYSLCFWEHTLAIGFGLGAILLLVPPAISPGLRGRLIRRLGAAGLLVLASILRFEIIFFAAALAFAWAAVQPTRRRYLPVVLAVLLATATAIACILLAGHADWLAWAFSVNISKSAHRFIAALSAEFFLKLPATFVRMLLLTTSIELLPRAVLWAGTLGLACCLGSTVVRARWRIMILLAGVILLSLPAAWLDFADVRYRGFNSVLLPAPLALLALLPMSVSPPATTFRRVLAWAVPAFFVAFLPILPLAGIEDGGLEWGSRYTLLAVIVMIVLAVAGAADLRADHRSPVRVRKAVSILAIWLILLGVLSSARGVGELRTSRRELLAMQAALEQTGGPVVTDLWWMGASLAPFAARHEIYTLSPAHPMREWLAVVGPCRPLFTYAGFLPAADIWERDVPPGLQLERRGRREQGGLFITRYKLTPR